MGIPFTITVAGLFKLGKLWVATDNNKAWVGLWSLLDVKCSDAVRGRP